MLGARFVPGLDRVADLPEAARATLDHIARAGFEKPWLLIYDNVERPSAIENLLPEAGAQVLITSRWSDWPKARAVPLEVFAPDVAVKFLLERAGRSDGEGAAALAEALGFLPLALDHAGATCRRTGMSFADYAAMLSELIRRAPREAAYPLVVRTI